MTVARLTQATTFMWLATSCVLAVWAWDESNLTAIALTTLFVGAHVWFLGLQFGAINWLNRAETAEAATPRELIVAWWIESLMAMRVFAWHQPFRSRAEPDFLANNRKRGVVLVHGFCCNRGVWNPWIKHMRAQGA